MRADPKELESYCVKVVRAIKDNLAPILLILAEIRKSPRNQDINDNLTQTQLEHTIFSTTFSRKRANL